MAELQARRVAGALGAEVEGIDLSKPLSADDFDALADALHTYQVIFLRGQHRVSDDDHLALARHFGTPAVYPVKRIFGIDAPLEYIEDNADSPPSANDWHTDVTWLETPPKVGILSALEIPEYGGDTVWASTAAAYEALSPALRRIVDGLEVRHGLSDYFFDRVADKAGRELADKAQAELSGEVVHPLVRTHPETGRRALFLGGNFMRGIVDMEKDASDLLLDLLVRKATEERFQCRWRWQEGDIAIWDERCTLHNALPDHYPQVRRMRRCTVEGERPH